MASLRHLRPWVSLRIPEGIATEPSLGRARVMLWWAVGFAAVFAAVYLLFVWTRNGQRWDDAAWYGHKVQDGDYLLAAKATLRTISLPSLAAASALLCLIAWARWGLRAGAIIGAFLVGTVVVAEVLKHWVLPRPEFYDFDPLEKAHNTLPSGHTTIGAMIAVGFILVLPRQVRGLVTVVVAWFAAEVGGSTLAAGWHRPSDALAGFALVGFATCLVVGLMLRRGSARLLGHGQFGRLRGWSVVAIAVPLAAIVLTWGALTATVTEWPLVAGSVPLTEWTVAQRDLAFTAGLLADYAAAAMLFTVLYLLLRRVEIGVPAEEWRRWHRRRDAAAAFESMPEEALVGTSDVPPEPPVEPTVPSVPSDELAGLSLLPSVTRDESSEGWGDREDDDRRYLDDVPPHHGG